MFKSINIIIASLILLIGGTALAKEWQRLVILHTNDIHGHLPQEEAWWINPNFPPPIGNAAAVATIIKEERQRAEQNGWGFLLVEGGDIFQGTPLGEFTKGQAVIDFMNLMGYDVMTVGNHDYDKGQEVLLDLISAAKFPMLGANLLDSATGRTVDYLKPYIILERAGLKIGIFGLITHYLRGMSTPEHIQGLEIAKESATAKQMVDSLKAQKVDMIIGLLHTGFRHDKAIADTVPGIDVIIGSHSHTGLRQAYEDPKHHTIIVQTFGNLTSIGKLELLIDPETKQIVGYNSELKELFTEAVPRDTTVDRIVSQGAARAEKGFDEPVGQALADIKRGGGDKESAIGNFVCNAMMDATGADIAFQNSAGIKADIIKGEITYRSIYKVDAFGNYLVTMDLTGSQVIKVCETSVLGYHAIFQVGGLQMTYDTKKPVWKRVVSVTINGQPIDTAKVYKVVTNNFLGAGGGNYKIFQEGTNREDTYIQMRQAMVDFVKKRSPVDARIEGRIRKSEGGEALLK
ncbi:MAG: 5'-nucleotidase C-terminal domain-containing protein [Candidatus Edwardsbacteria bacterium]|nr:5'-nucleotidase C-terminal domain-containing protein [Candidatus Edwardsbacteria bacterium]MBU1577133.1 5'-nucleotidase C-terminal domain-containing protein [Candidatus Edwardsbacteria bacterium]MBU2463789.1 5'-nucleotidase C-terminal domain-containing protein [Candidatus Edwardsbacteria bacterium]MBU2593771.1 5'-nucleotidase C-terminal domain-containing protein [Candidatus Edwardsbacteria bacterium]